jgi:hypothetical protein
MTTGLQQACISITSANCLAVTGLPWRWVLGWAKGHGVQVKKPGKRRLLLMAHELQLALLAAPPVAGQAATQEAQLLAGISRRLKGGR